MTLNDYITATGNALRANPPSANPRYHENPVAVWQYYMHCFGAGLSPFDPHQVDLAITDLYSSWFMRAEFSNANRPAINARDLRRWIIEARDALPPQEATA